MAGDFNKPSGSSLKANFMDEIRDMFADLRKMLPSISNQPTDGISYDGTNKRFQKYNGTSHDVLDVTGLTAGLANTVLANGAARTATNTPGANNVVVLDANGDLNQGSELVMQKHSSNLRSWGRRNAASVEQFLSGRCTYLPVNAYYNGVSWNRIDTGQPALMIGMDYTYPLGPVFYTAAAGANPLTWSGPYYLWHAGNDGPGSGLDADLLDGIEGSGYARVAETGLRVVRGTINANGTIAHGSGFTVNKTATGTYIIQFNPAFSAACSGTANLYGSPGFILTAESVTDLLVNTFNTSSVAADLKFSFIAAGPV
jgi:hypothetical protein